MKAALAPCDGMKGVQRAFAGVEHFNAIVERIAVALLVAVQIMADELFKPVKPDFAVCRLKSGAFRCGKFKVVHVHLRCGVPYIYEIKNGL